VPALVLKYRLLPGAGLRESCADLAAAVAVARRHARAGPVAAVGFSAGGHLVASACARGGAGVPDAQVLVYPALDGSEWLDEDKAGFGPEIQIGSQQVRSLARDQARISPGRDFVPPPPTFLVASTGDSDCAPATHSDPYAQAAIDAEVPLVYMRDDFGEHGFALRDFWATPCLKWLQSRGFGRAGDRQEPWETPPAPA